MRGLSIRFKITFWFTAALLLVACLAYVIVLFVNHQILQKTIRDNLVETVEHNVDEIEFYDNLDNIDLVHETDYFCAYRDGYLEIDDDFLDQVNEVYTALYHTDMSMLHGENPISQETAGLGFLDAKVQRLKADGIVYYVFDRELSQRGLEGLWLRGVVSEKQGISQMSDIIRISLLLLPLLVLVSAIGGSLLAGRMLRPIQEISASAAHIGTGSDLKKRIELGEGKDELHQLADSFNSMFQRLEEAFEAERQFASDASHELRTPVSVITAQCEYSLEEPRSREEYEQALQTIQRQGRKMARLIHDMLDFTRLEMRADSYPREELDLAELVRSLCGDLALIQEKGIHLECQAQGEAPFYGNRQLLARMLTNLVSNAYRYGKEGGHILVRLECAGQEMGLSVADDGIGIAPEEQGKIFQRFYQADQSRMGSGTGLGLSMVAEIVRFHGGEISVESELGQGSCFRVMLKLSKGQRKSAGSNHRLMFRG